jgi:hypothetical protein
MDRWIADTQGARLRAASNPLVIDLGFGASAVTTIELATRLRTVRADVRVLGLEIDPSRVATALASAEPPSLKFERGGFELAGHRPVLVRAANVLRQYDEASAETAWTTLTGNLAPDGVLVEGTCDELGRRASWILLDGRGPRTLTLACRVSDIDRPSDLAERLPKALIHHNVPGEPIHRLLSDFDAAWNVAATPFGPRQRWTNACQILKEHWPLRDTRSRWQIGELTVDWDAVKPLS